MLDINTSGDSWTTARRRAVLLHCLGTEGQRIFYTLQNTGTTYDEAMSSLEAHVTSSDREFNARMKQLHSTLQHYENWKSIVLMVQ